jgi:hypothetical protein
VCRRGPEDDVRIKEENMAERIDRQGLKVDARMVAFIEDRALPGTGRGAA